jgi:hypothetical protein
MKTGGRACRYPSRENDSADRQDVTVPMRCPVPGSVPKCPEPIETQRTASQGDADEERRDAHHKTL